MPLDPFSIDTLRHALILIQLVCQQAAIFHNAGIRMIRRGGLLHPERKTVAVEIPTAELFRHPQ